MVQQNQSRSHFGVLRGLHYQLVQPQGKLVRVSRGSIFDVAVDIRKESLNFGKWAGEILDDIEHRQLWVPPGFAKSRCEALRSCQKGSVGSIDTWIQQHATHFLWHSAFGDEEDSDLWCDSEMRSLAARHSKCKLPNHGASVEVVQVWQKLVLQDRGLEARSD